MKAAIITEEQIKAIRDGLDLVCAHFEDERIAIAKAWKVLESLKVNEPVAHVSDRENCKVWWSDKFTHISQAPKNNTPLYAGEQP